MNKVNLLSALMSPCPLMFLTNLSNADGVALVANCEKIKQIAAVLLYLVYLSYYQEINLIQLF